MRILLLLLISFSVSAQTGIFNFLRAQSISSAEGATGVYGVTKINKNYNGHSVTIYDNTTTLSLGDFDWVLIPPYTNEYKLDETSIDAALGGHEGKVGRIYEQSGNGYDLVQSTLANMPYYRNSAYTGELTPSIHFNNASGGLDHYMVASLPTDSNDYAFATINQGSFTLGIGTVGADIIFNAGGNPSLLTFSDNTVFRQSSTCIPPFNTGTTAPVAVMNLVQMGGKNKSGVGSSMYYSSFYSQSFPAFATQRINSSIRLGSRLNGSNKMLGFFKELIIYNSTMNSTVEARMKADQNRIYGIKQIQAIILDLLHSKRRGYTSVNAFNDPIINSPSFKLKQALGGDYFVITLSVPSATIQSYTSGNTYLTGKRLVSDYPTLRNMVTMLDAGNNFAETFSTIQTRQENLVADYRSVNPNLWWIFTTVTSRTSYDATAEALRLTWNNYLLGLNSYANRNIVIDITGISSLMVGGAGMDVDGIHWNATGNTALINATKDYYYKVRYKPWTYGYPASRTMREPIRMRTNREISKSVFTEIDF